MNKLPDNKKNSNFNDYAKYSGMAMEMFVLILLGILGGRKIDSIFSWEIPIFTMLLSLLGLAIAFYRIFKDLK